MALLSSCHIIEIIETRGESYRLQDAKQGDPTRSIVVHEPREEETDVGYRDADGPQP